MAGHLELVIETIEDRDKVVAGSKGELIALRHYETTSLTEKYLVAADRAFQVYARFGIPETWLVDMEQGLIEVYRVPVPGGYQQVRTLRPGEPLSPQAFPELILTVDELLGLSIAST